MMNSLPKTAGTHGCSIPRRSSIGSREPSDIKLQHNRGVVISERGVGGHPGLRKETEWDLEEADPT